MKTSKKIAWLLPLLLPTASMIKAQSVENADNFAKMVDFLPPAPNAAAMARYGGIAINKNTGTPNVSIPLYTLKGKKLSADVRISYAANGIRVDEIASRAGMGWVFNASWVVTRTVRGWADETHTRKIPWNPVDLNWSTYNYMKEVADATFYSGTDGEPDLFTYSSPDASGSFVLDHDMSVVQIPYKNQLIAYNFTGTDWNFKITNEQGIVYYYGGTGAVEKTKRTSDCAKSYVAYTPTAWYLKKIQHPNGETINFFYEQHTYTYDDGVSETMTWDQPGATTEIQNCFANGGGGSGAPAGGGFVCPNKSSTQGVLLTAISNGNAKIQIGYTSRTDCEDKLISSVTMMQQPGNTVIGYYQFYYNTVTASTAYQGALATGANQTPYLHTIREFTADGSQNRAHLFGYNNPGARPARLTWCQDHWGYFNGKANTTLIPAPADPQNLPRFPFATANREPDGDFTSMGLLSKIVYPTGGMDSIVYELNTEWGAQPQNIPHEFTCSVTGVAHNQEVSKTFSFEMGSSPAMQLDMVCTSTDPTVNVDSLHDAGILEIVSTTTGAVVYSYPVSPGYSYNTTVQIAPPGYYNLVIRANGKGIKMAVTQRYGKASAAVMANLPRAGTRVKTVLTANPANRPMVKRYYYGELATPNQSSAADMPQPEYFKVYKTREMCTNPGSPGSGYPIGWRFSNHLSMHSNSLLGLFNFQSSPVSYASVIESEGDDFENGAVQTSFNTVADRPGFTLWGNAMLNAPKSTRSNVGNGQVLSEKVLKKGVNGMLFPLKTTQYNYSFNEAYAKSVWGYTVNKIYSLQIGYDTTCELAACPSGYENLTRATQSFEMMKYEYPSYWITNTGVTETLYDENGQNPVVTQTNKFYDDIRHLQLTRQEQLTSAGRLVKTTNQYPVNFTGTAVYDAMLAKNIRTPLVSSVTEENNAPVATVKINYGIVTGNNIEPVSVQKATLGNTLETDGTIDLYDDKGNILQYTGKDGITSSIIWGYGQQYPVAKITGAAYAQSIAQLSVTPAALQSLDGNALRAELNLIRTGLPATQVTSYTYQLFAGVSSITSAAGKTNTYQYDTFNRLASVIDQDGNTVQNADYAYASASPGAALQLYFNTVQQQLFSNTKCAAGYTSYPLMYTVPAGKHFSVISQADADAKAQADMQANGQAYANKNSTCYTSGPCSGPGQKMVNCMCQTGTKIYTSSVNNGNGTYTCVYYYHWSDGTNSPTITETNNTNACTDGL
jgi:YD repeat-containing protein